MSAKKKKKKSNTHIVNTDRPVGAAYSESKAEINPIKHCEICAMFVT